MAIWAIVPAAGQGKRMGASVPKQHLPINGKTVLQYSLERLARVRALAGLVLVLHPDDGTPMSADLPDTLPVLIARGGNERCHSVLNALNILESKSASDDWILVHDAARPCLRAAEVDGLLEAVCNHDVGGLLAAPVSDTLKKVNDKGEVVGTVSRSLLHKALTPQVFRFNILRRALKLAAKQNTIMTDESAAVESLGLSPLVVRGSTDNIKITHTSDLFLAELIIKRQISLGLEKP
ncbi:MAG: 2-C-methyl-D-erythritol 4-phosphate cytidylyltransferase [Gammaproteobacteria bacterium]|nr:2-C-methyl-D-erythritol 4-phosphate cytidylyltransferase [Gammaproteobacteria bacterium]